VGAEGEQASTDDSDLEPHRPIGYIVGVALTEARWDIVP
jgi:hypothetical protein